MMRFSHMYDLAYTVHSNDEEASVEEILKAMKQRVEYLEKHKEEIYEACNRVDTYENGDLDSIYATEAELKEDSYYSILVEEDVEPFIQGPFSTFELRDKTARVIKGKVEDEAGIFWLDIKSGKITIGSYSRQFLEDEN